MNDERSGGFGRNIQETGRLRERLKELDESLSRALHKIDGTLTPGPDLWELCFKSEAYAWTILQYARAVLFEERLGLPSSDNDVFSVFVKVGRLDLVQARKLKQFCELRHLSSRDLAKLDLTEIRETVRNRSEVCEMVGHFTRP